MDTLVGSLRTWRPLFIGLVGCFVLLSGCKKTDKVGEDLQCPLEAVNGAADDILGKWKLTKVDVYSSSAEALRSEDHSCGKVVYEFGSANHFHVTSDISDKAVFESGNLDYSITESNEQRDGRYGILHIEGESYYFSQTARALEIEMNPINPLAFYESSVKAYFVRIR